MDLASGYNQVPVTETDRAKTAFCTPFGLFEWNRMPYGLCNAPSTFQRLMERLFGDQQQQSLLLYLNDIVVFSSSVAQHLERLEVVLSRLKRLKASRHNEILAVDFTMLEPSSSGIENILVMTDIFTEYTLAVPTRCTNIGSGIVL